MSNLSFDNLWVFYLMIPAVAALLIPFLISVRKDNVNRHNVASLILHMTIALLLFFAAAGAKIDTVITRTDVFVVADVSYSANKNLDTVDGYIKNLKKKLPANSEMGVVCFGKNYQLVTPLGASFNSVRDADMVDDSETNISSAVQYASRLFPDGVIKRIVLITDGKSTYKDDNLRGVVAGLVAQNFYVDAIYLDDNLQKDAPEVQITSATFRNTAYKGRSSVLSLNIDSNTTTQLSEVRLYKNDVLYGAPKYVDFSVGTNIVEFELDTEEETVNHYRAEVVDADDGSALNNNYSFTQKVSSAVNVLVYYTEEADYDAIESYYGEDCHIDKARVFENADVPYTVNELCRYDEIVVCNADLSKITYYETLINSIESVVSNFGKSLTTYGNLGIQSPACGEANALSKLSEMMPVRFGKVASQPRLYTIVLDISLSMRLADRMTIARQAALILLGSMSDDDYVCVVAFSGDIYTLQQANRVGDCKAELTNKLKTFEFRQGTLLGAALNETLNKMKTYKSLFSEIQVMLMTDGMTYEDEYNHDLDASGAVNQMRSMGITTSAISVGAALSTADVQRVEGLASIGGGNFYRIVNEEDVESVMYGEVTSDSNNVEVTGNTWITVNKPRDNVLAGLDTKSLYVDFFLLGTARASATTVLSVNYVYSGNENLTYEIPLYSYWNYGNGRVASYSGKVGGIKARLGEGYNSQSVAQINSGFYANVFSEATPQEKVDVPYTVNVSREDKTATVELVPVAVSYASASTLPRITVTALSSETGTPMVADAPMSFNGSTYTYRFNVKGTDTYRMQFSYTLEGITYESENYMTLSYLPEYDEFTNYDSAGLFSAIASTGTVSEDGKLELVNDNSITQMRILRLAPYLLIAAAVIFVVDIGVRKLKWEDIVSFFGGSKYKKMQQQQQVKEHEKSN